MPSLPLRRRDGGTAEPEGQGKQGGSETFAALRVAEYRVLFTAGVFSFIAVQSQAIARGWLANELTGSNKGLGGVFMAFGLPMLLATPFGGVTADRYSKRAIMIISQVALMTSSLWIGLGVTFDFIEYWMLLVASAVQATSFAFMAPARMAMTSEVVGRSLLMNAIVLGQMSMNATRIVGPALAGIFIGIVWIGTAGVYYFSALLSLAATFAFISIPKSPPNDDRPSTSMRSEFADTLRYVWRQRHVAHLLIVSFLVVMIGFPFLAFLPRYATEILDVGSAGYGGLAATSAVGAVIVSWLIAGRARGAAAWRIQAATGFGFGVALILMGLMTQFALALLAVALVGGMSAGFQAMNNSLVLAMSDMEHHGRVQSMMMLSFGGFGMAALPLGALADEIGLGETFVVMGCGTLLAMSGYAVLSRRARRRFGTAQLLA